MATPHRRLVDTLSDAASQVSEPGPLSQRLAFVAQRTQLRRSASEPAPALERVLARLEEIEREARRQRPCVALGR